MDIILSVGKMLLRLMLLVIEVVCDTSLTAKKKKTSIYGALEAHDLYEKGDISLDECLIATRPK